MLTLIEKEVFLCLRKEPSEKERTGIFWHIDNFRQSVIMYLYNKYN